jgi:hypothetical protein
VLFLVSEEEFSGSRVDLILGEHATFIPLGERQILRVMPMNTVSLGQAEGVTGYIEYPIAALPETFRSDGFFYCQAVVRRPMGDVYSTALFLRNRGTDDGDDLSRFHPSHVHFPEPAGVEGWLKDGDLTGAVTAALNSPGDEIKFNLKAGVSGGAGVNIGLGGSYDVRLQRIEGPEGEEMYELLAGGGVAYHGGVEVYEDLEFKVGFKDLGAGVVFRFDHAADAAKGLRSVFIKTALADRWGPDLAQALEDSRRVREAMRRKVRQFERYMASLPPAMRKKVTGTLSKLRKRLAQARQKELALVDALKSADEAHMHLQEHYWAVEFKVTALAELELKLAIPVNIAGIPQMHAAAAAGTNPTVRYRDLTPEFVPAAVGLEGPYFELTINTKTEVELKYGAGAVIGMEDAWKLFKTMKFVLVGSGGTSPTVQLIEMDSQLNYEFLRSFEAALVVGAKTGYGRSMTAPLPGDDLDSNAWERWNSLVDLVHDVAQDGAMPDWSELPEEFQKHRPFSIMDNMQSGAFFKAGASYLGCGAEIEGSMTWIDQGPKHEEELSLFEGYLRICMEGDPQTVTIAALETLETQ